MRHPHPDALAVPGLVPQHARPPPTTAICSSPLQITPSLSLWHTKTDPSGSGSLAVRSASEQFPTPFFDTRDRRGPFCRSFTHPSARAIYPSPPSPSGDRARKGNVPLPDDEAGIASYLPVYATDVDAILDSPEVMHRVDLTGYKPLTPPPTQRHPTQALPGHDSEERQDDEQYVDNVPGGRTAHEQGEDGYQFYDGMDGLDDIDEEGEEAQAHADEVSSMFDEEVMADQPPSPLSPEWPNSALLNHSSHPPSSDDFWMPLWSPESHRAGKSKELFDPPVRKCDEGEEEDGDDDDDNDALDDFPRLPFSPVHDLHPRYSPKTTYHCHRSPSPLFRRDDPEDYCPPSSPSISSLDLPELDDDPHLATPNSPSIRSAAILPDDDVVMVEAPHEHSLISPSQGLLSLPGGDVDDDLLPAPSSSRGALFVPPTPNEPLLLLEDPQDVPFPRSPSPEDFDLGFSAEDVSDATQGHPEASRLFELRRRSIAAERAASRLEHAVVAGGMDLDLTTRAEARRIRRREKERSREVSALLRLKLEEWCGDGAGVRARGTPALASTSTDSTVAVGIIGPSSNWSLGSGGSGGIGGSPKERKSRRARVFGSVRQLVAQMYFRRNEVSRPIMKRRPAVPQEYARSSLSRSFSAASLGVDEDGGDDVEMNAPEMGLI